MKRYRKIVLAVAGSVAILSGAGTAYAHSPWSVTAGTQTSGSVPYSATAAGTWSNPAITITIGASNMTCNSSSAAGDVTLGATPGFFASITDFTLHSCLMEGILPMELSVSATPANPWAMRITNDAIGGVSPVRLYDIHGHMRDIGTGGWTCAFDVDGTIDGTFDSGTQQLAVSATSSGLVVSNVTGGCFGWISNGNSMTFAGDYDVTNPVGPFHVDH